MEFLNGDKYSFLDNDPRIASSEELERRSKEKYEYLKKHSEEYVVPRMKSGRPPPLGRRYELYAIDNGIEIWDEVYDEKSSNALCPKGNTFSSLFKHVYFGVVAELLQDDEGNPLNIKFILKDELPPPIPQDYLDSLKDK